MEEINEGVAIMRALEHLIHLKTLGPKQCDHGVDLGSDRSVFCNSAIRAPDYIATLVPQVRAKGELTNKEDVISELLKVLEALGVFYPEPNSIWDFAIV